MRPTLPETRSKRRASMVSRSTEVQSSHQAADQAMQGSLRFIGTATVLLRVAGFRILTDPNFLHKGERARLGYGLRSTRRTNPAIEIDQLPPLDLILLSHLHDDHFDRVAERRLPRETPLISTEHAAGALRGKGFERTHALQVWQSTEIAKDGAHLRVTAMPGKHAPGP